jgi:hypothetical protein
VKGLVATGAVAVAALAAIASGPAEGRPSDRVTMSARPAVVSEDRHATLFGSVDTGKADEIVTIEAKNCGQRSFTEVASGRTDDGGAWSVEYWPGVNTTLRAKWRGAVSEPITLGQRAWVRLAKTKRKDEFGVSVTGKAQVWRKRILFQRRQSGAWKTVKSVVLTKQFALGAGTVGSGLVATAATFRASVPRGTLVRAVLSISQARPCYLAGVSDPVRA